MADNRRAGTTPSLTETPSSTKETEAPKVSPQIFEKGQVIFAVVVSHNDHATNMVCTVTFLVFDF